MLPAKSPTEKSGASKVPAIFFIFSFLTSLVALAHGILPIGLLLLFIMVSLIIQPVETNANLTLLVLTTVALGLMSIAFIFLGMLKRERLQYWLLSAGAMAGIAAWTGCLLMSENRETTFVFSIHFIIASLILLIQIAKNVLNRLALRKFDKI